MNNLGVFDASWGLTYMWKWCGWGPSVVALYTTIGRLPTDCTEDSKMRNLW